MSNHNRRVLYKLIFAVSALFCTVGCTQVGNIAALQDKPRSQDLVTRRAPKDNSFIAHGGYVKDKGTLMKANSSTSSKPRLPSDEDWDYGAEERPETVSAWLIYSFGGGDKRNPSSLADLFSERSDEQDVSVMTDSMRRKRRAAEEAAQPQTFGEWFHATFNTNNLARPAILAAPMQAMDEGSAAPTRVNPTTASSSLQRRAPRGNNELFAPRVSNRGPLDEGSAEDASYAIERLAPAPVPSVATEVLRVDGGNSMYQRYQARAASAVSTPVRNEGTRRRPKLNQTAIQASVKSPFVGNKSDGNEKTYNEQPKVHLGKAVKALKHLATRYGLS
ncbi:MAG: hypothetical protein JSS50_03195 [Proteobacteria bacterium]|nr:hypothetical protein [Pseudomonadota bacterium]